MRDSLRTLARYALGSARDLAPIVLVIVFMVANGPRIVKWFSCGRQVSSVIFAKLYIREDLFAR